MKFIIGAAIFLLTVLVGIGIFFKTNIEEPAQKASISDALLLKKNLKNVLNVHSERVQKPSKTDTLVANEIWYVPNGISIPNYMLRASREIERCKGTVHWMREIRGGSAALLKYEGEQGMYPLTEIRIIDSIYMPNSSKLAVVLAVREQNKIFANNPEMLDNLDFSYNLLILSSRPEFLKTAKKLNVNIIPWIPMESRKTSYDIEKKSQIPVGIGEKELAKKLEAILKKYDNANGFAAFNGEDFLVHQASVENLANVLHLKKLWFWDLTLRGTDSPLFKECSKKELRCGRDYLEAESKAKIETALREARSKGKAILLFELTEKSIELLKNLPSTTEKQGTTLVVVDEVF